MQLASLAVAVAGESLLTARPYQTHVHDPETALSKYLLRLFVTGASSRTGTAIANLRRICEQELEGQYDLEIIDVQ